jgi:C1A family cysteine protease
MSEQFLYWNCKQNDGISNKEGTWITVAIELLKRDGVCAESVWPYNAAKLTGNESQGPPPANAATSAAQNKISSYLKLSPTSVDDIKFRLGNGWTVPFSIPVFNSWYKNPWVRYTGDLTMPVPGEGTVGGHAMCIVGYQDLPSYPEIGGGRFLIRNSWGDGWAPQSCYAPGYGTIPYAYISGYNREAFSIDG